MQDELFSMPQCKSPKLRWMERHGIRTFENEYMSRRWMAIRDDNQYERGDSEDEALVSLARKVGIKSWTEETTP